MQNNQAVVKQNHSHNEWGFIPTVLFSGAGIAIGLAIGNFLGWV